MKRCISVVCMAKCRNMSLQLLLTLSDVRSSSYYFEVMLQEEDIFERSIFLSREQFSSDQSLSMLSVAEYTFRSEDKYGDYCSHRQPFILIRCFGVVGVLGEPVWLFTVSCLLIATQASHQRLQLSSFERGWPRSLSQVTTWSNPGEPRNHTSSWQE